MNRACFYNHPDAPSGSLPFKFGGKCLGFVSHTFNGEVQAAAIIEDDKSGILVVVRIKDVIFTVSGNLDKR